MFSVPDMLSLTCSSTNHLDNLRHPDIAVANGCAAAAADAGHRELALNEVVCKFSEEASVAAIMHGAAGIEAARHPRKPAECASIPGPHALKFVWPDLAIAHGETRAGGADVSAAATLQTTVTDFFPSFLENLVLRDIADGRRKPAGCVFFEAFPCAIQQGMAPLNMFDRSFVEDGVSKESLARWSSRNCHEFIAEIHKLKVEVVVRSRTGVGAKAKAFFADILIGIGANQVDEEQVLAMVVVIHIAEFSAKIKAVEMINAGYIARADTKNGALGLLICRLNVNVAVSPRDLHQAFNMRKDESLGWVVRVWQMDLYLVAVLIGNGIEVGVAAAAAKRCDDLVSLLTQEINDL